MRAYILITSLLVVKQLGNLELKSVFQKWINGVDFLSNEGVEVTVVFIVLGASAPSLQVWKILAELFTSAESSYV